MFPVLYFFYHISLFLFIFSSSLWSSVRRLLSLCANQGGSRGLLKSRTWVSDRSSPPSHFFLRRSPFFLGGCFDRLGRWCVTPLRLTLPEHPPPTLHTIHTSLPLTVGGWRQRPTLTPTTPSSKDSTQNATPFSTYCYWSAYNLYLFACVLLTQALGKVGFIKCYQHWLPFPRKFSVQFFMFSYII